MIKRLSLLFIIFLLFSCSNIELVYNEYSIANRFKDKTKVVLQGNEEEKFTQELFSFFGNNKNNSFILLASFSEKKENRLVKKNQVAEKTDYELTVSYEIFYQNMDCIHF